MKFSWRCPGCGAENSNALQFCKKYEEANYSVGSSTGRKPDTFSVAPNVVAPKKSVVEELNEILRSAGPATSSRDRQTLGVGIITSSSLRAAAESALRADYFSTGAVSSYRSEVRLYEQLMIAAQINAWPMSVDSVNSFAGGLKVLRYRGAQAYLSAVCTCNKLLKFTMPPEVAFAVKMARASLACGSGDDWTIDPITIEMTCELSRKVLSPLQLLVGRLMLAVFTFAFAQMRF